MLSILMLIGKAKGAEILPVLVLPAVIIAIVCAVFYISRQREKARTEKLANIFLDLGFPFQADLDPVRLEHLSGFPLMNIGRGKQSTNVISVEGPNTDIAVFDYRYLTGGGDNRKVRKQTVMSEKSTSLVHPAFNLRPEGF
jgi:hypothetical protein